MTDLQVPAHIAARIAARKESAVSSAIADALAGFSSPPRISIRASRFRLIENSVETVVGTDLDVIIVGANPHVSKVFFEGEYDADAGEVRPTCSSANGSTPDDNIESPACGSCAQCPNNVLGSKITTNGNKSKLCSDVRYLAVVPAADPRKVYSMNISVMAMKPLRQYSQSLGNYGISPDEVVTSLGFDDDASYPLVTFSRGAFLPEKALTAIDALKVTPEVLAATREDVRAMALPAPSEAAVLAPAKTNVVPIEEEPVKTSTRKAVRRKQPRRKQPRRKQRQKPK